jgi:UDP-N-acetyl-D-mannosaminuronate dehydrogenase
MKKILCVGLGKLGLIFSQILAENGYKVIGHDVDPKIKKSIENNEKNLTIFYGTKLDKILVYKL